MGIPEGPKKPLTSYFRFLKEVRPLIKPTVNHVRELTAVAAAKWKKMDENQKQKYVQAFEKEKVQLMTFLCESNF